MFGPLVVPLASPFTDDTSSVSEVRFARLVRFHRDRGAAGFLVCSEAGEWPSLAHAERKLLVEWAVREAAGLHVFVHVTAATTSAMIDLCQHAARHGARGAVFGLPPFGPYSPEEVHALARGLRRHANVAVGYLGPERLDESQGGALSLTVQGFEGTALAPLALGRGFASEEGLFGGEAVTPLGVFGSDGARKLAESWSTVQVKAKALFAHGRSFRVAKAYCETIGIQVGPPRGPMLPLDPRGREMLAAVMASL